MSMQRSHFTEQFPIARRLNGERLTLFAWSRAILMQLGHPLIAAGVAEHSSFRAGPVAAALRLHQTVRAMLALTFGIAAERDAALDAIRTIHRQVRGHLKAAVGHYRSGTYYSAEDPELVLWVQATLLDSVPMIYERLVGPLTPSERDEYCRESAGVAIALGADSTRVPRDRLAAARYLEAMLCSDAIVVGDAARQLADAVLRPPLRTLTGPAAALNRLVTMGLLPERLRVQYGFEWSTTDDRRLDRACLWIRRTRRIAPAPLARWRVARASRITR
jgi:uncharacterized protein (DUF2236 family)